MNKKTSLTRFTGAVPQPLIFFSLSCLMVGFFVVVKARQWWWFTLVFFRLDLCFSDIFCGGWIIFFVKALTMVVNLSWAALRLYWCFPAFFCKGPDGGVGWMIFCNAPMAQWLWFSNCICISSISCKGPNSGGGLP